MLSYIYIIISQKLEDNYKNQENTDISFYFTCISLLAVLKVSLMEISEMNHFESILLYFADYYNIF